MLSAIILAAGEGRRLKAKATKPLVKINNIPAIVYSLKCLNQEKRVSEIIVVLNLRNQKQVMAALKKYAFGKIKCFVLGGKRRQDSVYNALKAVNQNSDWVLIHDAARPFISALLVNKVILAAKKFKAAILGVRVKATIKSTDISNFVTQTLDRNSLWEVQTPQVFKKELLLAAYGKYVCSAVTDDASLVEKLGQPVKMVPGSYENIKITTREDLLLAEIIAKRFKNAI